MKKLTKQLCCLLTRQEIEIWIDKEKADKIKEYLIKHDKNGFIIIENQMFQVKDIVGIFDAIYLEERKRRKEGQWKCKYNKWHPKGEECRGHLEYPDLPVYPEQTEEEEIKIRKKINEIKKNIINKFKE